MTAALLAEIAEEAAAALWYRGELSWKLHSGQRAINDKLDRLPPEARQVVFLCGRRWGKSFYSLFLAVQRRLKNPGSRALLLAPYANQAAEITGPLMNKLLSDAPDGLVTRHRSSNRWNFANGSTLIVSGMDLIAETKRGLEFDEIFLEESGSSDPAEFMYRIQHVLFPMLLASRGRIFHVTTLPREEDHPFITDILPRCDAAGSLYEFPTTECPLYTKEQLDEMCQEVGGPDSIAWRREFLCQRVRDSSLVAVPEFGDGIVREFDLPSHFHCLVSGDLGGSRDRTHFLLLAYDFKRAVTIVIDERSHPNNTATADIIASVREMEAAWKVAPARFLDCPEQLRLDLMRDGFPTSAPVNRTDKFEVNLNLIRTSIGNVEIHPRCRLLVQTLRYGRLNKQRNDFQRTEALGHADAMMALCYGIRHINRNNPFPLFDPSQRINLHVPEQRDAYLSDSAKVLRSLFTQRN